jgi:hypothetical protein
MLDLGVGGPFLHHDDHESFLYPSLTIRSENRGTKARNYKCPNRKMPG